MRHMLTGRVRRQAMAHWLAGFWEPAAVFMIAVLAAYRNLVSECAAMCATLAARGVQPPSGGTR